VSPGAFPGAALLQEKMIAKAAITMSLERIMEIACKVKRGTSAGERDAILI
jgi:hypothetical protein